jgi:hypothetical protein
MRGDLDDLRAKMRNPNDALSSQPLNRPSNSLATDETLLRKLALAREFVTDLENPDAIGGTILSRTIALAVCL